MLCTEQISALVAKGDENHSLARIARSWREMFRSLKVSNHRRVYLCVTFSDGKFINPDLAILARL